MKILFKIAFVFFVGNSIYAQDNTDMKLVTKACMNYIEGFYEGDTVKLITSLKPTLHKFGYWKDDSTGEYKGSGMTYEGAKKYAKGVLKKKNFPKADAPRSVEVLDVINHIACAKVTAWWGVDYILLSKESDKWMIEQVLWQGPLNE